MSDQPYWLIMQCDQCSKVWAMDYQPSACTCPDLDDGVGWTLHDVPAASWRNALDNFIEADDDQ